MMNFLKRAFKFCFNIKTKIGKIFTTSCLVLAAVAAVGVPFGLTKCAKENNVVETNYFIDEEVPLHQGNYSIIVSKVKNISQIYIINKKDEKIAYNGNFISVEITLSQNDDSNLKQHRLDANDFKIKDHTGVYLPLNEIMGAIGWDAIDIHIDEECGGHVVSSTKFSTSNSIKDYHYIDSFINKGNIYTFKIFFETEKFIDVSKELIVFEIDFFVGCSGYKKASDIILLNRPLNLTKPNIA